LSDGPLETTVVHGNERRPDRGSRNHPIKSWADQGLNIDVPAIPAGLAAFTQSQDV